MDMLAQVQESVDIAKSVLETSQQYGFAAYCLGVLFLTGVVGVTLYFWKVVIPEREARVSVLKALSDSSAKTAVSIELMTASLTRLESDVDSIKTGVAELRLKSKLGQ